MKSTKGISFDRCIRVDRNHVYIVRGKRYLHVGGYEALKEIWGDPEIEEVGAEALEGLREVARLNQTSREDKAAHMTTKEVVRDLIETLRQYQIIIVSGPQRSGTRIAAKILAEGLNYQYMDEDDLMVDSLNRLCRIVQSSQKVVQCPALSRYVHLLADSRVAVVFMVRDIENIIASQVRIKWSSALPELLRYDVVNGEPAVIKYDHWKKVKRDHCYELSYLDLAGHPLWVDKEYRQDFDRAQTTRR